ncbi:MAG: TetR/AcrR family transcriptional regulator [Prolixibacteraceae bacterium]
MEDNQKYQDILLTAQHLFWKFGIKRVTIEEICKEAGVSKMTFYRFFKNKIELARIVLGGIFTDAKEKYLSLMAQDIPFAEKVKQQVIMKFEGTKEISAELIKDIYSGWNAELKDYFEKTSSEMVLMVRNDYLEAIDKGWIRKDVKVDFIFYMSQKMAELSSDPALLGLYNNPQELIMEFMNMMFYGILPRNDE